MTTLSTTLHDRLKVELDRRLAVARAATPGPWQADIDEEHDSAEANAADGHTVAVVSWCEDHPGRLARDFIHIALHDPADAIRRYVGELDVLQRHAIVNWNEDDWCSHCVDGEHWPCPEIRSLAARLGVSVDG